jgi:hypothetical protein
MNLPRIHALVCIFIILCSLVVGKENLFSFDWKHFLSHEIYVNIDEAKSISIKHTNQSKISADSPRNVPSTDDRIASVNGIPILSSSLADLLTSKTTTAYAIPIIDDDIAVNDGYKLLGFASIQIISPKDILVRRFAQEEQPPVSVSSSGEKAQVDKMVEQRTTSRAQEMRGRPNDQPSREVRAEEMSQRTKVSEYRSMSLDACDIRPMSTSRQPQHRMIRG